MSFCISINKVTGTVVLIENVLHSHCEFLGVHKDNALRSCEFLEHFNQEVNLFAVTALEFKLFHVRKFELLRL
jgi:hypothetical protein